MNTYIKIRAAQEVVTKSLVPPGGRAAENNFRPPLLAGAKAAVIFSLTENYFRPPLLVISAVRASEKINYGHLFLVPNRL